MCANNCYSIIHGSQHVEKGLHLTPGEAMLRHEARPTPHPPKLMLIQETQPTPDPSATKHYHSFHFWRSVRSHMVLKASYIQKLSQQPLAEHIYNIAALQCCWCCVLWRSSVCSLRCSLLSHRDCIKDIAFLDIIVGQCHALRQPFRAGPSTSPSDWEHIA